MPAYSLPRGRLLDAVFRPPAAAEAFAAPRVSKAFAETAVFAERFGELFFAELFAELFFAESFGDAFLLLRFLASELAGEDAGSAISAACVDFRATRRRAVVLGADSISAAGRSEASEAVGWPRFGARSARIAALISAFRSATLSVGAEERSRSRP